MTAMAAILDIGTIQSFFEILYLHFALIPSTKFHPIQHMVREEVLFKEFQDVCHRSYLGYQKVLANLNLHSAPMPPTKFQLNLTYRVKSGIFGHMVNLDIYLQTVEIQIRFSLFA